MSHRHRFAALVALVVVYFAVAIDAKSQSVIGQANNGTPSGSERIDDGNPRTDTVPQWIWGREQRISGEVASFAKTFEVGGTIESASLNLASDFCRCEVSLNQQALAKLDEFAPWMDWDVTAKLRPGTNEIRFACVAGEGPSAIAASLHLTYSDGSHETLVTDPSWVRKPNRAISFGRVARQYWNVANLAKISAFEDYEQWRRATGAEQGTDPATFATTPGFQVDLVRSARSDEGSWVSMAVDSEGRVIIAREDKGLLRMTPSGNGDVIERVEVINEGLQECRGLLFAHDALYVNANNSKGLYRLRDADRDGSFELIELLREFPGSVGHGRNDLALGPDGMIYSIHGDAVDLPTEDIVDRTSPLRRPRDGGRFQEGHLVRTDRDGKNWELVASGLRNPFGIDFNLSGEVFTYDADNEYDMGAPWYRPTRFVQIVSGGDYGWERPENGAWPPQYPDHAGNALPTVDVGKGSPTAVKFGTRSSFPRVYQDAFFALDWAYGRILACHMSPRGAGYACRVESFLAGRPLNVTDLDFSPDGNMYLVTGGRKTKSGLYRIRYVGAGDRPAIETSQQIARSAFSDKSRMLRRKLAELHSSAVASRNPTEVVSQVWAHLAASDPLIRNAARVALEHVPVGMWRAKVLSETDPETAATGLLALARARVTGDRVAILDQLAAHPKQGLSALAKLSMIRTYRLILKDRSTLPPAHLADCHRDLLAWFGGEDVVAIAPVGSGGSVRQELGRLVADQRIGGAVPELVKLLEEAQGQRELMNALYMLCHQEGGWSMENRIVFFESLGELERTAFSGAGMPGRLQQIRERASATLDPKERDGLSAWLQPVALSTPVVQSVTRPFVRKWTVDEIEKSLHHNSNQGDPDAGRELFQQVLCASCHRVRGRGGVLGPDLTSVASRFGPRDILRSIIDPSAVIAEKYRGSKIVTKDGRAYSGQVLTGGDYRSSMLKISVDPLDPTKVVEIPKEDVEMHRPSNISTMPAGLLDTLTSKDVADLLSYLNGHARSGG